jgi:hypothetical protein
MGGPNISEGPPSSISKSKPSKNQQKGVTFFLGLILTVILEVLCPTKMSRSVRNV